MPSDDLSALYARPDSRERRESSPPMHGRTLNSTGGRRAQATNEKITVCLRVRPLEKKQDAAWTIDQVLYPVPQFRFRRSHGPRLLSPQTLSATNPRAPSHAHTAAWSAFRQPGLFLAALNGPSSSSRKLVTASLTPKTH